MNTAKIDASIVKQYMRRNVEDHVDPLTGEISFTALAEDAFWALENGDGEVPEEYFELAWEVATRS